ncbi:MerR family transcriptional regulator [Saccharopolyspora hirsuta]|uniref:MerR family transcriptional regulator n=1 Tax=Saccharopolyspora hirsuta TaxID=1837 RepID=UPI0033178487
MSGTDCADEPRWSIGALAKATGTTVRALHHYDELGLLRPSARTGSGHRRYTDGDLQRLCQIRLLRELGMSLEEIGGLLVESGALREELADHLDGLDEQIARLTALRDRTQFLLDQLNGASGPDTGALLGLFGSVNVFGNHIPAEQRAALEARADELGSRGRELLNTEWPLVTARLARHCLAGDPVDAPEVLAAARRFFGLVEVFTARDPGLSEAMVGLIRERGFGAEHADVAGTELMDYVDKARELLSAQ